MGKEGNALGTASGGPAALPPANKPSLRTHAELQGKGSGGREQLPVMGRGGGGLMKG